MLLYACQTTAASGNVEQRCVIQVDSPLGCEFEGRSVVRSGFAIPRGEEDSEDSEGVFVYGREVEWLSATRLNVAEREETREDANANANSTRRALVAYWFWCCVRISKARPITNRLLVLRPRKGVCLGDDERTTNEGEG
jgi:hypothetical protein